MTERAPLVVHLIYSLGTGGLENGLVNIINRTPAGRYRHAIVCLTEAGSFAQRIEVPDVQVYELHKREGKDLAVYWRLWCLLRRLRPQIVHSRNLAALDSQLVTWLIPRTRSVHGEHGRDIYDLEGKNRKYVLLRKFMRHFVDSYITVSRDLQQWLLNDIGIPSTRVRQIYNGVDLARFSPGGAGPRDDALQTFTAGENTQVVGTVGRLAEVKNQDLLLRAAHELVLRQPQWRNQLRIVIVGDGPQAADLRAHVEELELDQLVWMAGDREDIPELLRAMQLFVLPSLAEGISNTLLEAMASGLAVVATDVGGNPELVEPGVNGLLVPSGDSAGLADAIERLLLDADLRSCMAAAGRQFVSEKFCWSSTVDHYLSVYDGLLGKSTAGPGIVNNSIEEVG